MTEEEDSLTELDREVRTVKGGVILALGCVWFLLDIILLPPGLILLSPLNLPDGFFKMAVPMEFVVSATVTATRFLVWRGARKDNSVRVYVAAFSFPALVAIVILAILLLLR